MKCNLKFPELLDVKYRVTLQMKLVHTLYYILTANYTNYIVLNNNDNINSINKFVHHRCSNNYLMKIVYYVYEAVTFVLTTITGAFDNLHRSQIPN